MAKPKGLSEDLVQEIREVYARKELNQTEIAKAYCISQSLVSKIVNNYIHKLPVGIHISGSAEVKVGYNYGN